MTARKQLHFRRKSTDHTKELKMSTAILEVADKGAWHLQNARVKPSRSGWILFFDEADALMDASIEGTDEVVLRCEH
ncbi:MAG: hypothetical protein KTR24_14530 [Saprospiraceae bacterium]|nr:hypothetical protein [Saprospiraceae bacterium]